MSLFKRKSGARTSRRFTRVSATLALGAGVLAGVGGALTLGSSEAFAGNSSVSYTCTALGNPYSGVGATVSETPDLPTTANVGGTYDETYSVAISIPAGLMDDAGVGGATELDIDYASLAINGGGTGGFTVASQSATDPLVSTGLPAGQPQYVPYTTITVPTADTLTDANGNPTGTIPGNATIDFSTPVDWTTGPNIGGATLSPGALSMKILGGGIALNCSSTSYPTMDSMTTTSPPQAPTVSNQSATVSAGGACTTINVLVGSSDVGDTTNPASTAIFSPPVNGGTATANNNGSVTYCSPASGSATTDSFQYTLAGLNAGLISQPGTVSITISHNTCVAGTGNSDASGGGSTGTLTGCSLSQLLVLPVTAGQIVMSQSTGTPTDVLNNAACPGGSTAGIVLNGNEQTACGVLSPMTVDNATGLDTGWTITGQTTDFLDPAEANVTPAVTCDTVATYNNHCIPGADLGWDPASGVQQAIVPGDTAAINSGPLAVVVPNEPAPSSNPILEGALVQPNNPVYPAGTNVGLSSTPAVLCDTTSGHSGGTFVCGAGLVLAVPASIAEPVDGPTGVPAYTATITLTLQASP